MPMQSLKNDHAICVLKLNTCAKNRHVIHNASDVDELKLLSSLNTLSYIEFDVLCNLSSLEEKLYAYADLPWFSRNTYHVFGKYNNKGQYMDLAEVRQHYEEALDEIDEWRSRAGLPKINEVEDVSRSSPQKRCYPGCRCSHTVFKK
jgi:hypothetical protein